MLMIQARRVDNASLNLGQLPLAQGLTRPGSRGCEGVTKTSFPGGRHVGNGPIVFPQARCLPSPARGTPRDLQGEERWTVCSASVRSSLREGGPTSKLHVVCDTQGRPVRLHLSQGQCSDFTGADPLLRDLPGATTLMGDRDRTATQSVPCCWSKASPPASPPGGTATRGSLPARGFTTCAIRWRDLLARLKDWRPIATRYSAVTTSSSLPSSWGPHSSPGSQA